MSPRRPVPKRAARTNVVIPGDPSDPAGFHAAATEWLERLGAHNYAPMTMVDHLASGHVRRLGRAARRHRPADVTLPVLEAYQRHVSLRRKSDGTPLSWSTQTKCLVAAAGVLLLVHARPGASSPTRPPSWSCPAKTTSCPRPPSPTPRAEAVLAVCPTPRHRHRAAGPGRAGAPLRDRHAPRRAGRPRPPRRGPGPGLADLRETKTRWDRVVPMGERAAAWLTRYLAEARPHSCLTVRSRPVFLATNGERLGATWLSGQVHRYVRGLRGGQGRQLPPLPPLGATLMLEGGADIRYVQELLGHRDLASTHIYTRVAPERLAAIHAATHPGARMRR